MSDSESISPQSIAPQFIAPQSIAPQFIAPQFIAPQLEETFAQSFGVLGEQLVAIRQQREKRYRASPAYKEDRKEVRRAARAGKKTPGRRVAYTGEEKAALKVIEDRAKKLRQVERILSADPELMKLTGAMMENQVKAIQRRQTRTLIAVAVVSLIAGWLLSAISPATVLAQLVTR
jgi:hypothetical protein